MARLKPSSWTSSPSTPLYETSASFLVCNVWIGVHTSLPFQHHSSWSSWDRHRHDQPWQSNEEDAAQKVQLEFADIIEDEMRVEGSGELTSVAAAVPSAKPAWSASQWSAFYGRSRLDEIAKEDIWERVRSASTRSTWDDVRKGGALMFDGGALQGIPYRGH